tara:strand:+ start:22 stop:501 length:480 start_codon:yes stop_codon:yes gene_type:complete
MGLIQIPEIRMSADEHIATLRHDHLMKIDYNEDTQEYIKHIPNYIDYLWDNAQSGSSWAGIGRGKVVAAFGIKPIWAGLAEMWMIPGTDIRRHTISIVRGAKVLTDSAIQDYDLKRLQIAVRVENDTAFRFAKSLNFGVESIMKRFGPEGADYYMMARF